MQKRINILLLLLSLTFACKPTFNFTGVPGKVDSNLETLFVDNFVNEAAVVVPYLAQEVTQQLQDKFLSQSRLSLTDGQADVEISGSITRYDVSPVAITGTTTAEQNRLTITIRVKFVNNVNPDPQESWESSFSKFVDFDASLDFTSIEEDQINEVLEQITADVFTKSLGKW